jgi:uncharacterized membrane protein
LAGLVVWLPIIVTFVVLRFIVDFLDGTLALLPYAYNPEHLLGLRLPGVGVILSALLLLVTGIIAKNFIGERIVDWSERVLDHIPLVRTLYRSTKEVSKAVFASDGQAFRKVVLVEYPKAGVWSLAFQTGIAPEKFGAAENFMCVFVPAAPLPTSGFLIMVAADKITELSMTVDDALKYIVSLGVLPPVAKKTKRSS